MNIITVETSQALFLFPNQGTLQGASSSCLTPHKYIKISSLHAHFSYFATVLRILVEEAKRMIINNINHSFSQFMQLQSYPHLLPAAKQSQYLLLHMVFLQLHFDLLPFCFLRPENTSLFSFRQPTQLHLSPHTFPPRKQRQYSFRHPLFMQLQNVFYSTFSFLPPFLKALSRLSSCCPCSWG